MVHVTTQKEVNQMSIKPVDFQIIIPRTSEVSKLNSEELSRQLSVQQHQAQLVQQKSEISTKQVYSQEKAYEVAIREKQERNRKGNKKDSSKRDLSNDESGKNDEKNDIVSKIGKIDIRI